MEWRRTNSYTRLLKKKKRKGRLIGNSDIVIYQAQCTKVKKSVNCLPFGCSNKKSTPIQHLTSHSHSVEMWLQWQCYTLTLMLNRIDLHCTWAISRDQNILILCNPNRDNILTVNANLTSNNYWHPKPYVKKQDALPYETVLPCAIIWVLPKHESLRTFAYFLRRTCSSHHLSFNVN